MTRSWLCALALAVALGPSCASAVRGSEIISEEEASRHGLTRAWFTQAAVDPHQGYLAAVAIDSRGVFVTTTRGVIQAIDAENGQTLWTQSLGSPNQPGLAPGVCDSMVAAVCGTNLMVFNRQNGKLLWKTRLEHAPGAGPGLSEERVYVPMVNGLIVSYQLRPQKDPGQELGKVEKKPATPEEAKARETERLENIRLNQDFIPPLSCQSLGRTLVPPLVTLQTPDDEYVAWPTDQGYLCVAYVNRNDHKYLNLKYRLQTNAPILAQPAYLPRDAKVTGDSGVIYAVSQDGFVHAIRENDGQHLWRFSSGEAMLQAPAVVGQRVYVTNQLGGMTCLDAKSGVQQWFSPGVMQFLAAGKERIYAADRLGRLLILDGKSGARLDALAAGEMLPIKPINTATDRIFLATKSGLIQCLHEADLAAPLVYRGPGKHVARTEPAKPSPKDVGKGKAADAGDGAPSFPKAGSLTGGTAKKSGSSGGSKTGAGKKKTAKADLEEGDDDAPAPKKSKTKKGKAPLGADDGADAFGAGGGAFGAAADAAPKGKAGAKKGKAPAFGE